MKPWLWLSLGALGAWGLWGLFAVIAARRLGAISALVWEVAGAVLVAATVVPFVARAGSLNTDPVGVAHALLTGVSYTLGLLLLFAAFAVTGGDVQAGAVHAVLMITALYPLVASLLSAIVLDAPLTSKQLIAMPLALSAVILLASDTA